MRQEKITYVSLCLCAVLLLFSACGKESGQPQQPKQPQHPQQPGSIANAVDYLGKADRELIAAKGNGIENISVIDGENVILSRVYREKFLGFDSELTVMLSSRGMVDYLLYSLSGEKEAVAAAISQSLGKAKPDQIEDDKTSAVGYKAIWRQDGIIYTMIAEDHLITVAVIQEG